MKKETKDDHLVQAEQELLVRSADLSEAEQDRQTRAALADVDAGRVISDEEMDRWMEKSFSIRHLPVPARQSS